MEVRPHIAVIGMGYVGTTMAACLAAAGYRVVGVEKDRRVLLALLTEEPGNFEAGVGEMLERAGENLTFTNNLIDAVVGAHIVFVCVGTYGTPDGHLDHLAIDEVCRQIGIALASWPQRRRTIVIRSTLEPGAFRSHVIPNLERAGAQHGTDFDAVVAPEFLREGSAIEDFMNPSLVVIGADAPPAARLVASVLQAGAVNLHMVKPEEAELVKLACNAWHACKVVFANEVGQVAAGLGFNDRRIMRILCSDRRLNTSGAYMEPGFAYGGSCLAKDTRALVATAGQAGQTPLLLTTIDRSNDEHIARAAEAVLATGGRQLGVIGLAHKPGTGDTRYSPVVRMLRQVLDVRQETTIRAYDPAIRAGREGDPRIALASSVAEVTDWCDVLVTTTNGQLDESLPAGVIRIELADLTLRPG